MSTEAGLSTSTMAFSSASNSLWTTVGNTLTRIDPDVCVATTNIPDVNLPSVVGDILPNGNLLMRQAITTEIGGSFYQVASGDPSTLTGAAVSVIPAGGVLAAGASRELDLSIAWGRLPARQTSATLVINVQGGPARTVQLKLVK